MVPTPVTTGRLLATGWVAPPRRMRASLSRVIPGRMLPGLRMTPPGRLPPQNQANPRASPHRTRRPTRIPDRPQTPTS